MALERAKASGSLVNMFPLCAAFWSTDEARHKGEADHQQGLSTQQWTASPSFDCRGPGEATPPRTAFRRWSSENATVNEVVPGLQDALRLAGLASYTALAESWCTEMGAAYLVELLAEFDDFCTSLSAVAALSPESTRRLRLALLASRHDGASRLASAPLALEAPCGSPAQPAPRRGTARPPPPARPAGLEVRARHGVPRAARAEDPARETLVEPRAARLAGHDCRARHDVPRAALSEARKGSSAGGPDFFVLSLRRRTGLRAMLGPGLLPGATDALDTLRLAVESQWARLDGQSIGLSTCWQVGESGQTQPRPTMTAPIG
ncbi:unnamed protein product [Prorocentrum cordatum]|uniref:Uncharacterized protein n=1 Tax=Prorocentrum cordatum TaxID=2364126 RepID=A0ABN9STF8_9DINO|nr:unnamed protein product [Polarella glacialis]